LPNASVTKRDNVTHNDAYDGRHSASTDTLENLTSQGKIQGHCEPFSASFDAVFQVESPNITVPFLNTLEQL
jgi:hypothetical protein